MRVYEPFLCLNSQGFFSFISTLLERTINFAESSEEVEACQGHNERFLIEPQRESVKILLIC